MTAASAHPNPKMAALVSSSLISGFARRAASRAPITDPTAMIEVNRPYWPEPPWNAVTDMVEMKIAKLSPNVPIRNSMNSTALRSGRRHT